MINLNNLYAFYICADQLSFSRAAEILQISQPSLSMQIKNLESQLGIELFLRQGKKISLTSRGKELLNSYEIFNDLNDEIKKCIEGKQETFLKPSLRILVTDEVERPFVAEVVSKLIRKEKKRMAIYSSTIEEALNRIQKNEADLLLTHDKIDTSWNFVKVDFPVYFATSSNVPKLASFEQPGSIEKVLSYFGEDLVVPAPSIKLGREFNSFRKKTGIKQNVLLESNIISCLVRFVASGAGCSFLPLPYIKSSLYEKHIHLIGPSDGYWKHSIYIYANLSVDQISSHPLVKHIRNMTTS